MMPEQRVVTFPTMGRRNSKIIKDFLESLDLNVLLPPQTTDETIKKGVKHCAPMICYPLKVTMGNYIEALDKGANTLLSYDTRGTCRFRMYSKLHEATLTGLGYDFEMFVMNPRNIISSLKKLSGKSRLKIMRSLHHHYQRLKQNDEQVWSSEKPNILIVGEIYSCVDEKANQGIEEKVRKFGCNTYNTCSTTNFMEDKIWLFNPLRFFKRDKLKEYKKQAQEYLQGFKAGHGFENLYNLLYFANEKKPDGLLHILPLSCMVETTIEMYINDICRDNKIPLLRIPIDENSAEKNLETRLEVFTELIKMKKNKNGK